MNSRIELLVCSAISLLAAGCAVINPTDPYKPVALKYSSSVASPPSKDQASAMISGPVSLETAIALALVHNPGLRAREHETAAAEARLSAAYSKAWPTVSVKGAYMNYANDRPLGVVGGALGEQSFAERIVSAEVVATMPLFAGGRIINQIQASELMHEAATHTLGRTRRQLVFNVSSMFYGILAQNHVIESLEFARQTLREHLDDVEALIESDRATTVDRLRTEVRLADVEEQLVSARNVLRIQHFALASLMGVDGAAPLRIELDGVLAFEDQPLGSLHDYLTQAYLHRNDYRAALRHVEASGRRVDVARAEGAPDIAIQAAYGKFRDASQLSNSADTGHIGLVLTLPIFTGGGIGAAIREQTSQLGVAQERLRELNLQVRLEVQTALSNVNSARERIQTTRKAIEQSRESLRIERLKHNLGEATITDVLDAQKDMLLARTNYYRALADYNIALAELQLATGHDQ